jgi:hypothetical protein
MEDFISVSFLRIKLLFITNYYLTPPQYFEAICAKYWGFFMPKTFSINYLCFSMFFKKYALYLRPLTEKINYK